MIPLTCIAPYASCRFIPGSPPKFSIIDVICTVTGNSNKHASIILKRILNKNPVFQMQCESFKFSGHGQRDTPVTDLNTIKQICKLLPKKKNLDGKAGLSNNPDYQMKCESFKFSGQGQRDTPVTDLNTNKQKCKLVPKEKTTDGKTGFIYLVQPA